MDRELQTEYLNVAIALAKEAGEMIRRAHEARLTMAPSTDKFKGDVDLVTETDKAVEEFIWTSLKKRYTSHRFIGEESAATLDEASAALVEPTWICDPIDGTTNFVHSVPYFCISLAYAERGSVQVGVVYNPVAEELFAAARGCGVTLNQVPISCERNRTRNTSITESIITTNVGYDRSAEGVDRILSRMRRVLIRGARGLQMPASAALQLAHVACGRYDCFYEQGINCWDIAAGVLLVEEAGGRVCDFDGQQPLSLMVRRVLATNGAQRLHEEMVEALEFKK